MRLIRSIQVNPDSVDLSYMDEGDVRCQGDAYQSHHISIQRGGNWDDEIDQLEAAAEALLTDVLVDFTASPAYDPMLAMRERYDSDSNEDDEDDE